MTSLKFLFPRILFFIALTASLGLQTEQHNKKYVKQWILYNLETQSTILEWTIQVWTLLFYANSDSLS